uniref:G protein-coupled receptor n=1 Tax=Caenorhabditis tropicalis TaxID=1561998 RepID=A0A1I7TF37_9PELO
MYDFSGNLWTTVVGVASMAYISVFSLYGAYLGLHTIYILQNVRMHLSPQIYALHKSAMISLFLQCAVPLFCVILPFNFIFLVIYHDWWQYQEAATCTIFLMAAHSMVSSLVLILSNQRFRRLIKEKMIVIPGRLKGALTPYSIQTTITPLT